MEDEKNDSSEKDNFLVNLDDYQAVRNFSNEDAGKLFHTICRYGLSGKKLVILRIKFRLLLIFLRID